MPEYLLNGIFVVLGAVIGAILTGVFAFGIAKSNRTKKEVTFSQSYPSSLLIVDGEFKDKLTIKYLGKEIESLSISEVFISNTGNVWSAPFR